MTAPIAPDPGYLAMAMTAAWAAGALSGALIGSPGRRRSRERRAGLSSLSPSLLAPGLWIVLFTVAAGVGQGRGRLFDAALFFASLLLYLLAEGWSSLGQLPRLGLSKIHPEIRSTNRINSCCRWKPAMSSRCC